MGLEVRNTNSIDMRPFGKAQNKVMRAYAQSRQYHTIVESRVRLTTTIRNELKVDNIY